MRKRRKPTGQPTTPSAVAVAGLLRSGAGIHGGGKRRRNRAERKRQRADIDRSARGE